MLQMLRFAKEVLLHIWLTSVNTHEQGIGARGVNSGLSPCRTTFTLGDVHHEVLELWMASDIVCWLPCKPWQADIVPVKVCKPATHSAFKTLLQCETLHPTHTGHKLSVDNISR